MGCKRPFEELDLEELSFKRSRWIELSNKINPISENVLCYKPDQKNYNKGKICW